VIVTAPTRDLNHAAEMLEQEDLKLYAARDAEAKFVIPEATCERLEMERIQQGFGTELNVFLDASSIADSRRIRLHFRHCCGIDLPRTVERP
jgi:hypothetical protein